jgi:hypothetical protein
MQEWKLPSQLVITDRKENESDYEMFHRHEMMRRLNAESDLIKALDLLDSVKAMTDNETLIEIINNFNARFLDKTINN